MAADFMVHKEVYRAVKKVIARVPTDLVITRQEVVTVVERVKDRLNNNNKIHLPEMEMETMLWLKTKILLM